MTLPECLKWRFAPVMLALLLVAPGPVRAADADADAVVLKSGKILQGRVVSELKVGDAKVLRVATDFGEILVPAAEVKERKTAAPEKPDAPFTFREIRIVEIAGAVQRHAHGETAWLPLFDQYRKAEDGPYADILPGDSVRTGADGVVAFIPSKDVWIRLTSNTEIEIPLRGAGASVELKGGDLQVGSATGPDGKEVRVRTGSSTVGVRGGRVAVQSKDGKDSVAVGEGEARVEGGPKIGAGSAADLAKDGPPVVRKITDDERERASDHFVSPPADDLVYIPAGEYKLGASGPLSSKSLWNEPAFTARIDGFFIGRTKVSNADFERFSKANAAPLPDYMKYAGISGDKSRPVTLITWEAAHAYARWCGMDLPTAVQWEVAARGPNSLEVPWGHGPPPESPLACPSITDRSTVVERAAFLATMSPIDSPTRDRSPFGVLGLLTFPYEYCRDWIEDVKYLPGRGDESMNLGKMPDPKCCRVMRGSSTTWITPREPTSEWWVGIRLAREIK